MKRILLVLLTIASAMHATIKGNEYFTFDSERKVWVLKEPLTDGERSDLFTAGNLCQDVDFNAGAGVPGVIPGVIIGTTLGIIADVVMATCSGNIKSQPSPQTKTEESAQERNYFVKKYLTHAVLPLLGAITGGFVQYKVEPIVKKRNIKKRCLSDELRTKLDADTVLNEGNAIKGNPLAHFSTSRHTVIAEATKKLCKDQQELRELVRESKVWTGN